MYCGATSKKSEGVENCSFRTNRSFFDFCLQSGLWTSYSFRNRDTNHPTLSLAWSKMLTAKINFFVVRRSACSTLFWGSTSGRQLRTAYTTMHYEISLTLIFKLIPTSVALPLIWKIVCSYLTQLVWNHWWHTSQEIISSSYSSIAIDLHFVVHWRGAR